MISESRDNFSLMKLKTFGQQCLNKKTEFAHSSTMVAVEQTKDVCDESQILEQEQGCIPIPNPRH